MELGGLKVHKVVGAVPEMVVDGLAVAVPPEMLALVPAPDEPLSAHNVTSVSTVADVAVACTRIRSGV